jgi:membrane associated rhomboid family serine protease
MRYRGYEDNLVPIWTIIIVNLLVFTGLKICQVFIGGDAYQQAFYLLGLRRADFLTTPWTIITSMFVHAGIWHILANMVTFYFFGRFLNRLIGVKNLLITYFGGGILGGIFYLLMSNPYTLAVGASGAVFALGGALTVLVPKLKVIVFPIPAPIPLWVAIIGGFIILSLLSLAPGIGIAWQGHLGGLVFGLVAGYFFRKKLRALFF